jgi:hypothetical protein
MTAIPLHHTGTHAADSPCDHRPIARRPDAGPRTHRFPAATYLGRAAAREERAFALAELAAAGRRAPRRAGALALLVAAAFAVMLVLLSTGRAAGTTGVVTLLGTGTVLVLAVSGLVAALRRHERENDRLAERVRRYESRLLELQAARRR